MCVGYSIYSLWSFCTGVRQKQHIDVPQCSACCAVSSRKQVTDAGKYGDAPPKQERGSPRGYHHGDVRAADFSTVFLNLNIFNFQHRTNLDLLSPRCLVKMWHCCSIMFNHVQSTIWGIYCACLLFLAISRKSKQHPSSQLAFFEPHSSQKVSAAN